MRKAALVLFLVSFSLGSFVSYKGNSVVSIELADIEKLQQLERTFQFLGETDIWTHEGVLVLGENHIRIRNTSLEVLSQVFGAKILIDDVGDLIDLSQEDSSPGVNAYFDNFRRYSEIVSELKNLVLKYPKLTKLVSSIGKSVEGRDIPAIFISSRGFTNSSIPRIFFQGGQHAREWIAPTTVMYIITKLLETYGTDTQTTYLVNNIEFVIVPLVNPDGYEYSFTNDRLWRKNRKKNTSGSFGVDLNRNWDDHWCGTGSSKTPSSDTYCGTAPFSEPETKAVSNFVNGLNVAGNILGHIDFHAYGQLVLRPYGWTTKLSPDNTALKIIGDGVSYEIQRNSGFRYTSQTAADLYITTGSADDYFYGNGVWASYTIELRDTGRYGFVLPASQIVPTGEEIWASVKYWSTSVFEDHP